MKSHEAQEPIDADVAALQRSLSEWESIASRLLRQLQTDVHDDESSYWAPHVGQIDNAVRHFRTLCRREIGRIGAWREDGLEPIEVHELVWSEADRLVNWLDRMLPDVAGSIGSVSSQNAQI